MLESVEWGEFKFDNGLFEPCKIQNKLSKADLHNTGEIPVYSSESTNNGIIGYTNRIPEFVINKENQIYVVFGDHTRSFNIATDDFCVADNVKVLKVKTTISLKSLLFITASWRKCISDKGYSRHWSIAQKVTFKLPIQNGKIDFDFMERFITELEAERIAELEAYFSAAGLKDYHLTLEEQKVLDDFENGNFEWGEFNLEKLFGKSTRGKRLKSADRIEGDLPFVTAGEAEEGVSAFIGNSTTIFSKNTTTIDMFGSAKYRNYDYGGDDHVAVVHTQNLPKYASIFVTAAIHKSSYTGKFDYGRNFYAKDADELNILLPQKNNQPNYPLMATLISAIHKLAIKDVVEYADQKSGTRKSD